MSMMKRAIKPPPIKFPATPEHPVTMNAELQYRLELCRALDAFICEAEKAQSATLAWRSAMGWGHELLIRGARTSIEDLGPLSGTAQRAELKEFIESLEKDSPDVIQERLLQSSRSGSAIPSQNL
jgi:hypothetical protein